MLNLLFNPDFWYYILIIGALVLGIFFSVKYVAFRWIFSTLICLVLVGTSIYSGVKLDKYYGAEGGIYGYIQGIVNNEIKVEETEEYTITIDEVAFSGTVNVGEHIVECKSDVIFKLDETKDYGVYINGVPISNMKSGHNFVSGEFTYLFMSQTDEVIKNDTLYVSISYTSKGTQVTLLTKGGDSAVSYWIKYFEKEVMTIDIKEFGYQSSLDIDILEDGELTEDDVNDVAVATYYVNEEEYIKQVYTVGDSVNFPLYSKIDNCFFSGWGVNEIEDLSSYTINEDTIFYACYNRIPSQTEYLNYSLNVMDNGVVVIDGDYVSSIPTGVFTNNKDIKEVRFENMYAGYLVLESNAFDGCVNLSTIDLKYVKFFGDYSLSDTSITSATLQFNQEIGEGVFSDCKKIKNVSFVIREVDIGVFGLEVLPSYTFSGCSSLESVDLPETLLTIKEGAFWDCSSLTYLSIPESVINFESGAFKGDLTNLIISVPYGSFSDLPTGFEVDFNYCSVNKTYASIKYLGNEKWGFNYTEEMLCGYYINQSSSVGLPNLVFNYDSTWVDPTDFVLGEYGYRHAYCDSKTVGGFVGVVRYVEEMGVEILDNLTIRIFNNSNNYNYFTEKILTLDYNTLYNYYTLTDNETSEVYRFNKFENNLQIA